MPEAQYSVLIVGGSRGLGLGMVKTWLAKRADSHVYATARKPDEAKELQAIASQYAGRVTPLALETTSEESLKAFAAKLPATLDSAWIVAGINQGRAAVQDATTSDLRAVLETNVVAVHAVAQIVAPRLIASEASDKSLVFYSTMVASLSKFEEVGKQLKSWFKIPARMDLHYGTSKAALNFVVLHWREYLQQHNVKTIAIHPGLVVSDINRAALPKELVENPTKYGATLPEESCEGVYERVKGASFAATSQGIFYWNGEIGAWTFASRALLSQTRSLHSTAIRMGVSVDSISPGDGQNYPKAGDKIAIHYVGTLLDGKKFDSSRDRGSPFECTIGKGQVIKGWDEGVPKLSIGEKAVLTCTPDYAYGARGFPPVIPPNSTLKFEVELLKINGKSS